MFNPRSNPEFNPRSHPEFNPIFNPRPNPEFTPRFYPEYNPDLIPAKKSILQTGIRDLSLSNFSNQMSPNQLGPKNLSHSQNDKNATKLSKQLVRIAVAINP